MLVILLSGKRYAGKDTFAESLAQQFGTGRCKIIALADQVREEYIATLIEETVVITVDDLKRNSHHRLKELHRPGLIKLAEDRKREHGIDYWSRLLYEKHMNNNGDGSTIFLVTDWRFIEEFAFFTSQKRVQVVTVRIDASLEARQARGFVYNQQTDTGRSETNLDLFPFDYRISNNDSKEHLNQQSRSLISWLSKTGKI